MYEQAGWDHQNGSPSYSKMRASNPVGSTWTYPAIFKSTAISYKLQSFINFQNYKW